MLGALDLSDVFMIGWSMGGGVTFSYFQNFGSHRLRAVGLPPWSWSIPNVRVWIVKGDVMARRRHTPEQVITRLREAEVALAQGRSVAQVCRALGVTEQTYYRWRKEMRWHAGRPGQTAEAVEG